MKALKRLEKVGYQFNLVDGSIRYVFSGPAGSLPPEAAWSEPLFEEIRQHRREVIAILQARLDWLSIYDEWGQDSDPANDLIHASRLALAAIAGQFPYYVIDENGEQDIGPDGWHRFAGSFKEVAIYETVKDEASVLLSLPWER